MDYKLDIFTKAYTRVLWAMLDGEFTLPQANALAFSTNARERIAARCKEFWDKLDASGLSALKNHPAKAGRDFALSSQGEASGFWERDPLDYNNDLVEGDLIEADILCNGLVKFNVTTKGSEIHVD